MYTKMMANGMLGAVLFGASVRGVSHARSGKPCQDSYEALALPDAVILSAADGHGSEVCPFSKAGSAIAANVFCKTLAGYVERYADDWDALLTFLNREGDTTVARAIDGEWKRRVEGTHRKHGHVVPNGIDRRAVWRQYGTTLLGALITPRFYFAFQHGDGDILYLNGGGAKYAIRGDKMLGTETHSLSRVDAWKQSITTVRCWPEAKAADSSAFLLATDGFANSYPDDAAFLQTCADYYAVIREHGADAVALNLKRWLNETGANGSGDDITALFACFGRNGT